MHTLTFHYVLHISWSQGLSRRTLNSENSENITSLDFFNLLHVVSVQFDHSAHLQLFLHLIIPNKLPFPQLTLIHSDVC